MEETIKDRIYKAMVTRNIKATELAKLTGLSKASISYYLSGKFIPKQTAIYLISKALNVSPSWLLGFDVPMEKQSEELEHKLNALSNYINEKNISSLRLLPIYGTIKAGEPSWAEQNIEGYIPFDANINGFSDTEDYFYLKVNGESMNQVVKNGDYALIQKTNIAEDGDIVVALVNGYDATLKKYKRLNKQFILLEPVTNDPSIESITVDLKTTNFEILGKFVGYFGKYNK